MEMSIFQVWRYSRIWVCSGSPTATIRTENCWCSAGYHWRRKNWCATLKRAVRYYEDGGVVLWRGWCGTLKMVVWNFEDGGVVLWRGWCVTMKMVVWYFEEGGVLLEDGGVVLWRGRCGTLKRAVWYFKWVVLYSEEGGVVLLRVWCFEELGVVLWRGWCSTFKRVLSCFVWRKCISVFDNTAENICSYSDFNICFRFLTRFCTNNTINASFFYNPDSSTVHGKVPFGVAALCHQHQCPCVLIGGSVSLNIDQTMPGVTSVFSICNGPMSLLQAIDEAPTLIEHVAGQIVSLFLSGGNQHIHHV